MTAFFLLLLVCNFQTYTCAYLEPKVAPFSTYEGCADFAIDFVLASPEIYNGYDCVERSLER